MCTLFRRHGSNGSRLPPGWIQFPGWAALALLVAVAAIPTAGGCQSTDNELARAEKAKAALVALARAKPSVLEGLDAYRLESMPVRKTRTPHAYFLGWITINVEERWYSFGIEYGLSAVTYRGTFTVDADSRWTAQEPEVVEHFDILPEQP